MINAEKIVAAARGWLGTPYQHQARIKGLGVDCVGLLIGVAREVGYVAPAFDINGYARNPDGFKLLHHLGEHLQRVKSRGQLEVGDIVLETFDALPQHVGIVGDYKYGGLSMIHAANKAGKVIETRLLFTQAMRFSSAYRFKGTS